jgi:AraC-like DNA-binding protein
VQSQYSVIDTAEQQHVIGVSFKPGGAAAFVKVPAYETCDADVGLDNVWGRDGSTLRERLLEAETPDAKLAAMERSLARAFRGVPLHGAVAFALDRFRSRPTHARIAAVTDAIGLSPKRFIERFKAEVGLTPKRYCRVLRLQQVIRRAHARHVINWTELALDCGYFDQAHFIHEFQSLVGMSPTAYAAARTAFPNHVTFLQDDTSTV